MKEQKRSNEGIKEITYREDLPKIIYEKKRIIAGLEVETEYISVSSHNIKDCEKLVDKYKGKKND